MAGFDFGVDGWLDGPLCASISERPLASCITVLINRGGGGPGGCSGTPSLALVCGGVVGKGVKLSMLVCGEGLVGVVSLSVLVLFCPLLGFFFLPVFPVLLVEASLSVSEGPLYLSSVLYSVPGGVVPLTCVSWGSL